LGSRSPTPVRRRSLVRPPWPPRLRIHSRYRQRPVPSRRSLRAGINELIHPSTTSSWPALRRRAPDRRRDHRPGRLGRRDAFGLSPRAASPPICAARLACSGRRDRSCPRRAWATSPAAHASLRHAPVRHRIARGDADAPARLQPGRRVLDWLDETLAGAGQAAHARRRHCRDAALRRRALARRPCARTPGPGRLAAFGLGWRGARVRDRFRGDRHDLRLCSG